MEELEEATDILMVDDVPSNLTALEAVLTPLGQRLHRASSGDEALRKVLRTDFACILLDVQMPGIDGFETARLIKERERSRHVPILFITAFSRDQRSMARGYAEGAVDYIVKPFNPDILRTKVAVLVDIHLQSTRLRRKEALLRDRERTVMEREMHERMAVLMRRSREDMALLDAFATSSPLAFALVSRDFKVKRMTPAFGQAFGTRVPHEELSLQRAIGQLGEPLGELVRQVLSTGQPVRTSAVVTGVPMSAWPLRDAHGSVEGVGLFLDSHQPSAEAEAAHHG